LISQKEYRMAMLMKHSNWISLVVAGALSACAIPPQPLAVGHITADALVGVEWTAIAIEGVVPLVNPKPKLQWKSVDRIVGTGGCNAFVGKVQLADGSMRIGPLAATGKACITAPTGQEDLFFKALEETRQARLEDGQLILLDEVGKIRARLSKTP
jgi:heat shock protein HslJ